MSKNPLKDKLNDDDLDLSLCSYSGKDVPVKDIAALKRATSLDLSNNRLTGLPSSFATLSHLVRIDLSCNQITSLPANFGDLRRLRHLDLYNNQLTHLPLSFEQLSSLRWLDLKKNPLSSQLALAAGTCLNQRECEQCARQVVLFMARVKQRYDEEMMQRERLAREEKAAELAREEAEREQARHEKKAKKEKKRQEVLERKKAEAAAKQLAEKIDEDIAESNHYGDVKSTGDLVPGRSASWLQRVNRLLLVLVVLLAGTAVYLHWDHTQPLPTTGSELWHQLGSAGRRLGASGGHVGSLVVHGASDLLSASGRGGAWLGDALVQACVYAGDVSGSTWLKLRESGVPQLAAKLAQLISMTFSHVFHMSQSQWKLVMKSPLTEHLWDGLSDGSANLVTVMSDGCTHVANGLYDAATQLFTFIGDSIDKFKHSTQN